MAGGEPVPWFKRDSNMMLHDEAIHYDGNLEISAKSLQKDKNKKKV